MIRSIGTEQFIVSLHLLHIIAQLCLLGLAARCWQIDHYPRLRAAMKARKNARQIKEVRR